MDENSAQFLIGCSRCPWDAETLHSSFQRHPKHVTFAETQWGKVVIGLGNEWLLSHKLPTHGKRNPYIMSLCFHNRENNWKYCLNLQNILLVDLTLICVLKSFYSLYASVSMCVCACPYMSTFKCTCICIGILVTLNSAQLRFFKRKKKSMSIVIKGSNMLWERNGGLHCEDRFRGEGGLA